MKLMITMISFNNSNQRLSYHTMFRSSVRTESKGTALIEWSMSMKMQPTETRHLSMPQISRSVRKMTTKLNSKTIMIPEKRSLSNIKENNFNEMNARMHDSTLLEAFSSCRTTQAPIQGVTSGANATEDEACDDQSESQANLCWVTTLGADVTNQPQDKDIANARKRKRDRLGDLEDDNERFPGARATFPTSLETIHEEDESVQDRESQTQGLEDANIELSHQLRDTNKGEIHAPPDSYWSTSSRHTRDNSTSIKEQRGENSIVQIHRQHEGHNSKRNSRMPSTATSINEVLLGGRPIQESKAADEQEGSNAKSSGYEIEISSPWYDGFVDDPIGEVPLVVGLVVVLTMVYFAGSKAA